jgi:LysM repeat protein
MKYLQLLRSRSLAFCLLLSVVGLSPVQAAGHTVKSGDTLSAIARKYGVSMGTLQKTNPGINPNLLGKGQVIKLPGKAPAVVSKTTKVTKPKRTPLGTPGPVQAKTSAFSKGAKTQRRSSMAREKEERAEQLSNRRPAEPDPVRSAPKQAKGIITHQVRSGETLQILARRSGVTVADLVDMNGLQSMDIRPQQKIVLPASAASSRLRDTAEQDTRIDLSPPAKRPSAPIPRRSAEPVAPPVQQGTYYHVVKNGETFYSIARDRGVSVAALIKANRSIPPNKLGKNQKLSIPGVQMAARQTENTLIDEPPPARVTTYRFDAGTEDPPSAETTLEASDPPVTSRTAYRVTEQDSLDSIAREFDTTPRELRQINRLNTFDRITVGSWLMVPWQKSTAEN